MDRRDATGTAGCAGAPRVTPGRAVRSADRKSAPCATAAASAQSQKREPARNGVRRNGGIRKAVTVNGAPRAAWEV